MKLHTKFWMENRFPTSRGNLMPIIGAIAVTGLNISLRLGPHLIHLQAIWARCIGG
jgi:hypothetical protein